MNEIILILKEKKRNRSLYVQFDRRLSLLENILILKEFNEAIEEPFQIFYKGSPIDINCPLYKMDFISGMTLEVYSF